MYVIYICVGMCMYMSIANTEELTFQGDKKKGFIYNHAMHKDHFLRKKQLNEIIIILFRDDTRKTKKKVGHLIVLPHVM